MRLLLLLMCISFSYGSEAFWGMIWGIAGMILAIPIMAILVISLSQLPTTRYMAILFSEKGNIPKIEYSYKN